MYFINHDFFWTSLNIVIITKQIIIVWGSKGRKAALLHASHPSQSWPAPPTYPWTWTLLYWLWLATPCVCHHPDHMYDNMCHNSAWISELLLSPCLCSSILNSNNNVRLQTNLLVIKFCDVAKTLQWPISSPQQWLGIEIETRDKGKKKRKPKRLVIWWYGLFIISDYSNQTCGAEEVWVSAANTSSSNRQLLMWKVALGSSFQCYGRYQVWNY